MPINLYSRYIKKKYGGRIQKIPIDAGFTCPNRDGTKGLGGCTYCNNESFSPNHSHFSIEDQIKRGIDFYSNRFPNLKGFIVYFQSYSNTYAPVKKLERLYHLALKHPGVIGLSIGTRPDCIDQDVINVLANLSKKYQITLEYGLESPYNKTLTSINRGHDFKSFEKAVEITTKKNIEICTHLILGLPGENDKLMIETANIISRYPINSLKIHQLHVVANTILGKQYQKNPFPTLSKKNYMDILQNFLIRLRPDIVIQRLFGEAPKNLLLSPRWPETIGQLNSEVINLMNTKKIHQGMLYGQGHESCLPLPHPL